jgi:DNA-binding IclR family transcriptional regulator
MSQVDRCLDVLELLTSAAVGLPLSTVAERLNLPKSVAHRWLTFLVGRGYVAQDSGTGRYGLTLRLSLMGVRYLSTVRLTEIGQPILDELAVRGGELIRMTVRDGDRLVWAARAQGARTGLLYDPEMGHEARLFCTATGHAFLAALPQDEAFRLVLQQGFDIGSTGPNAPRSLEALRPFIERAQQQGYAVVADGGTLGTAAGAAAITAMQDGSPVPVGTVSIAGPTVRLSPERLHAFARDHLVPAARRLGEIWPLRRYVHGRPTPAFEGAA